MDQWTGRTSSSAAIERERQPEQWLGQQPPQSTTTSQNTPRTNVAAVASLRGTPVTMDHLRRSLIELGGGEALAEVVLDLGLRRRLQQRGESISDEQIREERRIFTSSAATDPNDAERILQRVRREQNLGDHRFGRLLWRNAALRMLVREKIVVPDAAVRQAYDYEYGPRYNARLIVVDSLGEASRIVNRARAGESFIDLAIRHSTDASRAAGGLVPPIRPTDTTWPGAIREQIVAMQVGQFSDPIILGQSFAILKLEEHIPAQNVRYEDVEPQLQQRARLGIERMHTQRLAREIVLEADRDLTIMERALKVSWDQQKKAMWGGEE